MEQQTLFQKIISHISTRLFGHKYYLVVMNRVGTFDVVVSSFFFKSKKDAKAFCDTCPSSFRVLEIVSIRSKDEYETWKRGNL